MRPRHRSATPHVAFVTGKADCAAVSERLVPISDNSLNLLKDMGNQTDYLSIGSGVAGLTFAIQAARGGASVSIVTKTEAAESNSRYAQGGIAAVFGDDDSIEAHVRDTLEAGAGLCDVNAVETTMQEGPQRVRELLALGAQFSRTEDGQLSLGREGGHSYHRVVHADDWTGRELVRTLLEAARAEERVTFIEEARVVDLIVDTDGRCRGAWVQQGAGAGKIDAFEARATLLATGGLGQVFSHTTNPSVATGDGIAMAYRAGATLANMEFVQFHPTALAHPQGSTFLITEALRGYGAIVVNHKGEAFVERQVQGGSLATRDVVARAIVAEMKSSGRECVYLDVSGKDPDETRRRFPTIHRTCEALGIDMTRDPIPIAPAAHYLCGGVRTDMDARTDVDGLLAAGEVACTGVHGANRLASNSLLEGLVLGARAARTAAGTELPTSGRSSLPDPPDPAQCSEPTDQPDIGRVLFEDVGIVRSDAGLARACDMLDHVAQSLQPDSPQTWRNRVTVGGLIAHAARSRQESRGVHYNEDHPHRDDENWQHDTLMKVSRA